MKKIIISYLMPILLLLSLTGCSSIGAKTASMSIIYAATTILSFLLLISYCWITPKKEVWFLLLFTSVFVVNIGYFTLSISQNLEEALLANRISYLGSVFLPMSMLMIILKSTKTRYHKWIPGLLLIFGIFIFLVAASPGYSGIYYREVSLYTANGVTLLDKVYGPWHCLYLFYLIIYFAIMIFIIVHSAVKKEFTSIYQSVILLIAVFVNICVWMLEQIVHIDFEFLSVSYIISELFLLSLNFIINENTQLKDFYVQHQTISDIYVNTDSPIEESVPSISDLSADTVSSDIKVEIYINNLSKLTKTERAIFDLYLSGTSTKDVLNIMNITENTLKFHNKNIYSKLEVSSRRQLTEIYSNLI